MKPLRREEFERMWRVLDQSLTAHSVLRDRYRRRQRALITTVMVLSIVATAIAFVSGDTSFRLGNVILKLGTAVGILTAAIFFLTLSDFNLNWQAKSWSHDDAVRRLADLKAKMRGATVTDETVATGRLDIHSEYAETMAAVPEIPERQFVALKARHHRKVELSRLIDSHRGAPVVYLRALLLLQGMRGRRATGTGAADKGEAVENSPV